MVEQGFIKLHRSLLKWEWHKKPNTLALWIYILMAANWQDGRFEGIDVPRGSFVTSIPHLSAETGLSVMQVKTALNHLKSTGEITCRATNKFTLITVEKYECYQSTLDDSNLQSNLQDNRQATFKQLSNNFQVTTIEEIKNIRNKEIKKVYSAYGEYGWVKLTDEEHQKLIEDLGEAEVKRCIRYIDESAESNGNKNKWKNWNLVIRKCSREKWGVNKATQGLDYLRGLLEDDE